MDNLIIRAMVTYIFDNSLTLLVLNILLFHAYLSTNTVPVFINHCYFMPLLHLYLHYLPFPTPPLPCAAPAPHPPPVMTEPHPMAKQRPTEQPSDQQSESLSWSVLYVHGTFCNAVHRMINLLFNSNTTTSFSDDLIEIAMFTQRTSHHWYM